MSTAFFNIRYLGELSLLFVAREMLLLLMNPRRWWGKLDFVIDVVRWGGYSILTVYCWIRCDDGNAKLS